MDGNGLNFPLDLEHSSQANASIGGISIEQLQRLVQMLDQSDVSELELNRAADGVHLVLRKVKPSQTNSRPSETQVLVHSGVQTKTESPAPQATEHKVVAPLVGTFHVWAKPRGGALVAVGDRVKAGQLVGTIESLNVLNEVETAVAGRVVEVHVQDGQPVEYGQVLMTIEIDGGGK